MRIGLIEFLLILAIASLTVGPRVALFVDRWMRRANRANAMAARRRAEYAAQMAAERDAMLKRFRTASTVFGVGILLVLVYALGFRTFLSGMAVGFDLAAAEAVLELRERVPGVRLVAAVPFRGQEMRFSPADRERFRRVLAEADSVEVLAPAYHRGCYAVRNDFLVDNARVLVAWYDGSPGGTRYTVRRALGRGLEVVNLCPAAPVPPAPEPTLFG